MTVSRIVLVLASSSHPDEEQSRKDCIETTPFWSEAKFASLLLKTARITQQNGWKICAEIGFSKNFAQTENKPEIFARGTRSPGRPNFTVWLAFNFCVLHLLLDLFTYLEFFK